LRMSISRMTHKTDIQLRFFDSDAFGHLSNIAFSLYAEQARVDFFFNVIKQNNNLILAHIDLDFKIQANLTDTVYVETGVIKIGNTSIKIKQDIYANDKVATTAKSVIVLFDYEQQKPMPIPDEARALLNKYLVD